MRLRVSQTKWHNCDCNWQESAVPKLTGKKFPVQIGFISVNASFLVPTNWKISNHGAHWPQLAFYQFHMRNWYQLCCSATGSTHVPLLLGLIPLRTHQGSKSGRFQSFWPIILASFHWCLTLDWVKSLLTQVFFSNEEFCACWIDIFPCLFSTIKKKKKELIFPVATVGLLCACPWFYTDICATSPIQPRAKHA